MILNLNTIKVVVLEKPFGTI